MFRGISDALKGLNGGYELTRVLGAAGGSAYIIGANAFVAWNMLEGREFDLTAYCLAFPSGLAAILAAVAGGASWKDKGVASAKVIETTGAAPGLASRGMDDGRPSGHADDPVHIKDDQ